MKTLSVMAQKGGAGKTTIAVHLAVLAEQRGRGVALVELDPQQSAADWWRSRQAETPIMVEAGAAQLAEIVQSARKDGLDLVVVDTPPHATYEAEIACRQANGVLIPCRPSILDLRAIGKTVERVKATGTPAGIVLNHCPPSRAGFGESGMVQEARAALTRYRLPLCPVALVERVALSHALIDGRAVTEFAPHGKAAREMERLFKWVEEIMV